MTEAPNTSHALELVEQAQAAKRKRPLRRYVVDFPNTAAARERGAPDVAPIWSFKARDEDDAADIAADVIPASAFQLCTIREERKKR